MAHLSLHCVPVDDVTRVWNSWAAFVQATAGQLSASQQHCSSAQRNVLKCRQLSIRVTTHSTTENRCWHLFNLFCRCTAALSHGQKYEQIGTETKTSSQNFEWRFFHQLPPSPPLPSSSPSFITILDLLPTVFIDQATTRLCRFGLVLRGQRVACHSNPNYLCSRKR